MQRIGLLFLCLLFYCLPSMASSGGNGITYSVKNAPLERVLHDLKKQSGYAFFYTYGTLDKAKPVTFQVKDATIQEALDLCFKDQPLTYTIKDKTVLIQSKDNGASAAAPDPVHPVHGRVVDSAGKPLAGVSVRINNTTTGAITDNNGEFQLQVKNGDVLHFSIIGYEGQILPVGDKTEVIVSLLTHAAALGDVVVVGYGTQRKQVVTAAISTLNEKDVVNKPIPDLTNSLVGRVAGVIATQAGGEPGFDGAGIFIRGVSTTGNTSPLIIVDGIPRSFSQIDPNSVQTITVLKDAAAIAPYGVAGANGVILVTTKKGASGIPTITYNGYVAAQAPTKLPKMVNSYQYAQMRNEANANDGNPAAYSAYDIQKFKDGSDPDGHPNSQPLKDVIRSNSLLTYHNFTISGGSERIKYFASGGYMYQGGMWSTDYLKKFNGSFNLQAKVTNTTEVSVSILGWEADGYYPTYTAAFMLGQAFRTPPTSAVYYSNGLWGSYIGQSLVGEIFHSGQQVNQGNAMQMQLSIEQQLPFIHGLSIKGVVAYDPTKNYTTVWKTGPVFYNVDTTVHPYVYNKGQQDNTQPTYNQEYDQNQAFTYQAYLNYHDVFGKHSITALAVAEGREQLYSTFSAGRINYSLDLPGLNYGGADPSDLSNGGYNSKATQIGYVYRAAYAYDNKYLLEATGRYDGNYYFAPGKKFGYFPAFSAGWVLSKESFIENALPWVDLLKLRGSWGESGMLAGQAFQYLSAYSLYGNSAVLGGATSGLYELSQANPDITWEKAKKTDVGLEAAFLHSALSVELDYFHEMRSNMLVKPKTTVSDEYGIGLPDVNAGVMSNHGFEATVRGNHRFSKDWNLNVTGTFTYARNKVLQDFETAATYNNPNRRRTGRPFNTQFGLKATGYYTANDFDASGNLKPGLPVPTWGPVHPGDLKYADVGGPNGAKSDGVIDSYDETRIGNPSTPGLIYSLEPRLSYKGFDLDLLFQGAGISSTSLYSSIVWPFYSSGSATELEYKDHWTPEHQNALYPRLTGTPTDNNTQFSSWWLRDTRYVRLKNLELGYTLPDNAIKRMHIHSARFYISGQNVWTWTPKIKETIDPENVNGQYTTYYQQRVWSFGANITF